MIKLFQEFNSHNLSKNFKCMCCNVGTVYYEVGGSSSSVAKDLSFFNVMIG